MARRFNKCINCTERSIEPNCHDTCKWYADDRAEPDKINAERRKTIEFNEAKTNAIYYTQACARDGRLKTRRNK